MNKIEDFINDRFGDDKLKHIAKTFDQTDAKPEAEYADQWAVNETPMQAHRVIGGATVLRVSFGPNFSRQLERLSEAARQSVEAAIGAQLKAHAEKMRREAFGLTADPPADDDRSNLTADKFAAFVAGFRADAIEYQKKREAEAYEMRQRLLTLPSGEAFVARADCFAETNGIDWIDAARICAFEDLQAVTLEQFNAIQGFLTSPAVQEAFKSITSAFAHLADQIADGMADVFDQPPRNRRERRQRKHTKRLRPEDQKWKRSYRDRHR